MSSRQWMAARRDAVLRSLGEGTYEPSPVLRVEIPKPSGGVRTLGVPTVLDRVIQQAIVLVLTPILDPGFSEACYGFRPGRSAHQAVRRARDFVEQGFRWVVDIDLEQFFDQVNHDVLMERLWRKIHDKALLRIAPESIKRMKDRVRLLCRRTRGVTLKRVITELTTYLRGWLEYYRLTGAPTVLVKLDAWLHRKLRCYIIKQRGRNSRVYGLLKALGVRDIGWIYTSSRGPWRMARNPQVHKGLSARYFDDRRLVSLHQEWRMLVKTT